ncbi:MAG TPA: hypothetical protein VD906_13255 [Caulobacteraceae bacterium]|nr:hypothetical protein [Caulobacteraceae bacterium]
MQNMSLENSTHVLLARLGWFLHTQLKGNIDQVSQRTRLATGTIRRYREHDPARIAAGGSGPQKIPYILRLLDDLGVNPAKLAVALHYSNDEATFWRLMACSLCIEERFCLQTRPDGAPKVNRRMIRLDPDDQGPQLEPTAKRERLGSRLLERFAWFLAERTRGRIDEISALSGVPPATIRRYARKEGAYVGRSGPQKVGPFLKILAALDVSPPKLAVAAHYGGNDDSFWMIMSSTLCAEESLSFAGPGGATCVKKVHRLDEEGETFSRVGASRGWGTPPGAVQIGPSCQG